MHKFDVKTFRRIKIFKIIKSKLKLNFIFLLTYLIRYAKIKKISREGEKYASLGPYTLHKEKLQ